MKTKRILALFLCVAALLTLIPSVTLAAESEAEVQTVQIEQSVGTANSGAAITTGGKAVTHGVNSVNGYDSESNSYNYVYYGTRDGKGVKWRVLDDETLDGNAGLFLMMEDVIGNVQFISYCTVGTLDSYENNCWIYGLDKRHNWWENSTARIWCLAFTEQITPDTTLGFSTNQRTLGDTLYNNNKAAYDQNYGTFTEFERENILETTKSDPNYKGNYLYYGRDLNAAKVFFLSADEASNPNYGLDKDENRAAKYIWMTRSAADRDCVYGGDLEYQFGESGINDAGIAAIYQSGYLSDWGVYTAILDKVGNVPKEIYKYEPLTASARPGMNIGYDSIVFASVPDAEWEKTFDLLDDYSGSEWKLTLGTGDSFSADLSSNILSSGGIEVTHPALNNIGETEYNTVTAELKNTDGETVAYGALNTADTSAVSSTLPLPSGLADGIYTLSLRAERWNGQNKTNYASEAYDAGTIYVGRDNSHNGHKFTPIYSEKQLADMTADDYCFLITDITVNSDTVYSGHLCLNGFTLSGDMKVSDFTLYDDDGKNGELDNGLTLTEGTLTLCGGTVNGGINLTRGTLVLSGGVVNENGDGYAVVAESGTTVTFPGKAVLNGETAGLYLKGTATVSAKGIACPARPYTVKLESSEGSFCTDWDETQDYVRYFSGANGYSVRCEGTVLSLIEYAHNVPAHPACGISCDHNGSHPVISDWQAFTGSETMLAGGNYILNSGITLEHSVEITGEVNLCLNGYELKLKDKDTSLIVAENGTLTVGDCSANKTGIINGMSATGRNQSNSGAVIIKEYGTFNLYSGTIKDAVSAVTVTARGNFDMYGGTISDSKYGVYNAIIGEFHMYGGTVKDCEYGVQAVGNTVLYEDSLITGCTKYGVSGDRMRAILGGVISGCNVGFSSGTVTDGGVVENCRIGANQYVTVESGGTIRNCTEYGIYASVLVMTGGKVTGCNVGIYLNPQKAKNGVNLMTVSGAPVISGNTAANVAVYSEIDDKSYAKVDVDAIYIGEEGISSDAVIPVRVITKDGDFESYITDRWRGYTFSGVYPNRDYSRYFKSDVDTFRIVHNIETNQLAFTYFNGSYKTDSEGNPIRCRILCYLKYDANGGSGSIDYSTLDDGYRESQYTPYECVRAADITNGDGRLIANPFTAPAGKAFAGWNTKADGSGVAYADKDLFRYSYINGWYVNKETVTLYAQWVSADGINVTFDANGGTCATSSQSVEYGATYGNLPTPVRENYDFIGWYTEKDGGSLVNERSMVSTLSDHTLYAHWKENGFTVSFAPGIDVPGGSGTMASVSGVTGAYKLPECTYTTPSGMKFKAWKIDGKEYAPGDEINVSKNISAVAVWIDKETVTVNEEVQTYGYDASAKTFVIKGNNVSGGFEVKYQKGGTIVAAPTDAGTYNVIIERAEDNTYKKYSKTIESGLVIAPKDINGAAVGSFAAMTYNGKEQTPQAAVTIDGLTATGEWSKVKNVTDKTSFIANGNFTGTIADKSTGMLKAASKINSEPSAKSGLVYDKTPHILITNGKPDGGVMKYSSDNKATWSEELPQAVNAGSYEVWYRVIGDGNHNDTEPVKIDVSIAKASVDIPIVASKIYTGSRQTAENGETELYTVSENSGGINVGRYDVKLFLKDSANYRWNGKADDVSEVTLDFCITKADNEWITKPGIVGWTYGETANAPVYAAKFGNVKVEYKKADSEDSTYTTTAPTNAGDYKVRFTVAATDDFGGLSEIIGLNIAKANAAVTAPEAKENLVYNGFAQALIASGSTEGGEIRYSSSKDGAYSAEVITGTNAGSYEIWYKVIGDSNHNDTEPVKINVSIAKASVSIPSVENKVYTGNVQTATISDTEYYTVSENNGGTNVGSYDVKLLLKDGTNYHWNGKADDVSEITLDFDITKADNEWTAEPSISGMIYGEAASKPVYAAKFGDVKIEYKKASEGDGAYKTEVPTNAGDYKVRFTVDATDNFGGLSKVIDLNIAKAAQPAPSSVTAVNETIKGKSDGKIIGVDSTMEYKAEGASEYTDVYGSEIANLAAGRYKVRYKETDNYFAGNDKTIEISEGEMITVTFESNGGTAVDSKMCEYNRTITAPESESTKEGYELAGWYADSEFMTEWNFGTDTFTENKALYAKWVQGTVSADESDVDGITAEGLNDVAKTEKTSISLAVRTQEEAKDSESQTAIKNIPDAPKNFEFYDISVKKSSGEAITETPSVIEIKLPYDFKKKRNIKVYRYHSGNAQELTQLTERNTAKPFDDGTCFVDTENGCIYIYSSKFSAYSVAYAKASSGSAGRGETSFTVRFETNGGNTIKSQTVTKNTVATEPAEPTRDNFKFEGWYTDKNLSEKYNFSDRVTKNITLYAKWAEKQSEPTEPTKPDTDKWNNPFIDVSENDWFYNNVKYAVQNELFSGTTATTFEPNTPITRGMVVTVLYREEGNPAVNKSVPFADVKADSYYANAVAWAEQNGIVMGTSETTFAPNDNITREQLAAIMLRFAKYKGYDVSIGESTNILSFDDFADISEYAIPAMQYAAGAGLINGKSATTLNPNDGATRAEAAAILYRFLTGNNL